MFVMKKCSSNDICGTEQEGDRDRAGFTGDSELVRCLLDAGSTITFCDLRV